MILLRFNPSRAKQVQAYLDGGEPIQPPVGGWNDTDMLSLAGVLITEAAMRLMKAGDIPQLSESPEVDQMKLATAIAADLKTAAYIASVHAAHVRTDSYDDVFEGDVVGTVDSIEGDGEFQLLAGLRDSGE